MKKLSVLFLLSLLTFSTVACGGSTGSRGDTQTNKGYVTVTPSPDLDNEEISDEISDVPDTDKSSLFPNSTEFTSLTMSDGTGLLTLEVPLDYVVSALSFGEDGEEHTVKGLNSASTTLQEAINAGNVDTKLLLSSICMTSINSANVTVTAQLYKSDLMSWDDFKTYYPDAKEIGDEQAPGLAYHVEALSGQSPAIAIRVNDSVTLQVVYESDLEKKIGTEKLAEYLYDWVTLC